MSVGAQQGESLLRSSVYRDQRAACPLFGHWPETEFEESLPLMVDIRQLSDMSVIRQLDAERLHFRMPLIR